MSPKIYLGKPASAGRGVGILYLIQFPSEPGSEFEVIGPGGNRKEKKLSLETIPITPYIIAAPNSTPMLTPWLLNAEGLILETGGVLSHAATICRELGIPCVGSMSSIDLIRCAGKSVEINGSKATVHLYNNERRTK